MSSLLHTYLHNFRCNPRISVMVLVRTGIGRAGLQNRAIFCIHLLNWVKAGIRFLGSIFEETRVLESVTYSSCYFLTAPWWWWSTLQQAGRLNQQTLCRLAETALAPLGMLLCRPAFLFSVLEPWTHDFYHALNFLATKSHIQFSDATNMLIKLVVNLPKFFDNI